MADLFPSRIRLQQLCNSLKSELQTACWLCSQPSCQCLCETCLNQLLTATRRCPMCGIEVAVGICQCGECLKSPKPYQRTVVTFTYADPLKRLCHLFKNGQPYPLGRKFAQLMCNSVLQQLTTEELPDLLVPVPSHWRKQFKRGYNPATVLTEYLSKQLSIRWNMSAQRIESGAEQKQLNRQQRLKNLRQSFMCNEDLSGLHIAVIDDVVTTCATAMALSKVLLNKNARQVDIWCLARTP